MFISALFVDKSNDQFIKQIDKKISEMAESTRNKYAFGIKSCEDTIDLLADLKSILIAKMNSSECYSDISEFTIKTIIKKYLI